MKYALIRYNKLKLLIKEDTDISSLIAHLADIESLEEKVTTFYKNMFTADKSEGAALDIERKQLLSKIGYEIIGVPFTNHDAELYALDKKLEYTELDLI